MQTACRPFNLEDTWCSPQAELSINLSMNFDTSLCLGMKIIWKPEKGYAYYRCLDVIFVHSGH